MKTSLFTLITASLMAFSANAATFERPAGAYTPTKFTSNTTKYQDDSGAVPRRAISSVKVDGDINFAIDGLNILDERVVDLENALPPSVVGEAGKYLSNNGTNAIWSDVWRLVSGTTGVSVNVSGSSVSITTAGVTNVFVNSGGLLVANVGISATLVSTSLVSATAISGTLIQAGASGATCGSSISGSIRWGAASNTLQVCGGTGWVSLAKEPSVTRLLGYTQATNVVQNGTGVSFNASVPTYTSGTGVDTVFVRPSTSETRVLHVRAQMGGGSDGGGSLIGCFLTKGGQGRALASNFTEVGNTGGVWGCAVEHFMLVTSTAVISFTSHITSQSTNSVGTCRTNSADLQPSVCNHTISVHETTLP